MVVIVMNTRGSCNVSWYITNPRTYASVILPPTTYVDYNVVRAWPLHRPSTNHELSPCPHQKGIVIIFAGSGYPKVLARR